MKLKRLLIMKAFFLMLGACNRFYVTVINIHSKTKFSLNVNGFSYPSFAKDTKELIFQYQNERYHISKLLIEGDLASSSFPVIESEYSHLYPDFSEQANKILYVSNEPGFYTLWMSDSKGMNRQQLTYLKKSVNYPRWSS
jgi:Tol biopolymer transport system component